LAWDLKLLTEDDGSQTPVEGNRTIG